MDQIKIEVNAKNTRAVEYKEELLPLNIEIPLNIERESAAVLNKIEIWPKLLTWPSLDIWETAEEEPHLLLPTRLTDPQYGRDELDWNLRKLAENAPGIENIWKITRKLPSLTAFLSEERDNE